MIIHGKNISDKRIKPWTANQKALIELGYKQGWFETIKTRNISLTINENRKGLLDDLRKIFKNNYVGKEKNGNEWVYTIYAGDKEFNEMMNKPLREALVKKIITN